MLEGGRPMSEAVRPRASAAARLNRAAAQSRPTTTVGTSMVSRMPLISAIDECALAGSGAASSGPGRVTGPIPWNYGKVCGFGSVPSPQPAADSHAMPKVRPGIAASGTPPNSATEALLPARGHRLDQRCRGVPRPRRVRGAHNLRLELDANGFAQAGAACANAPR